MKRRNFLKTGIWGALGFSGSKGWSPAFGLQDEETLRSPLPRRMLGRTGEEISIVGLGGMVVVDETAQETQRIVRQVLSQGINYFDVAPTYGNAEELLGLALAPVREKVFLACKTQLRDRRGAEEELNRSLEKLRTDHFDLYQLHALMDIGEVNQALGRRGAIEAVVQAKEEGKIRHIGFSAHSQEAALRALELFDFDTILFPVNYVCWYGAGFGPEVIETAHSRDMGILAIKSLARQPWPQGVNREVWPKAWYQPITAPEEMDLALRFTLSQPVTAAVPPGDIRLFRRAIEIAHSFTPLNDSESRLLQEKAASLVPLFPLNREG
jgi:predicted aldo/keto reductase-like oxidoreductase